MAQVYTFRVLLDIEEDVFRDIQINSKDLFSSLHTAIQKAFEFDNSQMASFYMSDEDWNKGQEVTLMKMDFDDGSSSTEMDSTLLNSLVKKEGEKMVYVFDFMLMWCFFIELISIQEINTEGLPKCISSFGNAPYQYGKKLEPKPEDDQHLLKNKKQVTADELLAEFDDLKDPMDEGFEELPDDLF